MSDKQFYKVVDAPGLLRDPHSKALISADVSALNDHRRKRKHIKDMIVKNNDLETRVKVLEELVNKLLENKINA